MKTRLVFILLALLAFVSCEQKATVEVMNSSGEPVTGTIDGNGYTAAAGQTVSQEITIGHKFIFGTSEKTITVTGEGWCSLPFSKSVDIQNDAVASVAALNNAGMVYVENSSVYTADVIIQSCDGDLWGTGMIGSGYWVMWSVPAGCVYIYIEFGAYYYEDSGDLPACYLAEYSISRSRSSEISVFRKLEGEEPIELVPSIAPRLAAKRAQLEAASPDKKLLEIVASGTIAPKTTE